MLSRRACGSRAHGDRPRLHERRHVVALPGPRHVLPPRCRARHLELLEVQLCHLVQHQLSLTLAQLEQRHLQRGAPAEGEVPGRVPLGLVHGAQPRRGVREALPAAEVVGPAHGDGHAAPEHVDVGLGDLVHGVGLGAAPPRVDDVRLEHRALHVHAVVQHRLVQRRLDLDVDCHGLLQVVAPLEAHVGLDDGHEAHVLADERVAREVKHVLLDDEVARLAVRHVDLQRGAPLGELAPGGVVLLAPRREAVEALHHGGAPLPRHGVHLEVGLHAGHDAEGGELLREQHAVVVALVHRLRVEDGGAQVVGRAGRLEQHLAVAAPRLLVVAHAHVGEAGADRGGSLVAGSDALAGRRHLRAHRLELGLALGREVGATVAGQQAGAARGGAAPGATAPGGGAAGAESGGA
mmetsp:Transcript_19634/g.66807  ORF Transcript_19634/g.66807 Transcript_19634/m.66807 type:complete len:407 (+) Transcript_19634:260-1480(+)